MRTYGANWPLSSSQCPERRPFYSLYCAVQPRASIILLTILGRSSVFSAICFSINHISFSRALLDQYISPVLTGANRFKAPRPWHPLSERLPWARSNKYVIAQRRKDYRPSPSTRISSGVYLGMLPPSSISMVYFFLVALTARSKHLHGPPSERDFFAMIWCVPSYLRVFTVNRSLRMFSSSKRCSLHSRIFVSHARSSRGVHTERER